MPKQSASLSDHHVHTAYHHTAAARTNHHETRTHNSRSVLEAMVLADHPKRGRRYAHYVAELIVKNARVGHLPMAAVAATACIESDFSMHVGPCVGMMQLNPRTVRERHAQSGLDPTLLSDNVRLGVRELAYHYEHTNHRASMRHRLAVMWGRYNGAGANSHYVRHALRVYDALS